MQSNTHQLHREVPIQHAWVRLSERFASTELTQEQIETQLRYPVQPSWHQPLCYIASHQSQPIFDFLSSQNKSIFSHLDTKQINPWGSDTISKIRIYVKHLTKGDLLYGLEFLNTKNLIISSHGRTYDPDLPCFDVELSGKERVVGILFWQHEEYGADKYFDLQFLIALPTDKLCFIKLMQQRKKIKGSLGRLQDGLFREMIEYC